MQFELAIGCALRFYMVLLLYPGGAAQLLGELGAFGPEVAILNEMSVDLRLQQVIFGGGIMLSKA